MSRTPGDLVWVSKNGRKTKIKNMQTRHIVNTIKLIERDEHGTVKVGHELYEALQEELKGRGKKRKVERILKGFDADLSKTGFMSKRPSIDS